MKYEKQILISMILTLILLFSLLVYINIPYNYSKTKNIFDEIYYDEHRANKWGWGNATGKIKGYIATDFSEPRFYEFSTLERYYGDSLPENFKEFKVGFHFEHDVTFIFSYIYNENIIIKFYGIYDINSKTITKIVHIWDWEETGDVDYRANSSLTISDKTDVKNYLIKYDISNEELDSYFNKGMNDIFLKDWFSVYNSRFNPDDLGEYEVIDTWKEQD